MGLLDSYIGFRVEVDLVSDVIRLYDNSSPGVPAGWTGAFVLSNSQGIIYNGSLASPNVGDGIGTLLTVPIVPGGDGYIPKGDYTIQYKIVSPGQPEAALQRTFAVVHEPISFTPTQILDVFTPYVRLVDNQDLTVAGYGVLTQARQWTSFLPTVGTINSTVDNIILQYAGQYYSGIHQVSFQSDVTYQSIANSWLRVFQRYSWVGNVSVPERPSFSQLLEYLDDLKAVAYGVSGCGPSAGQDDYLMAESLLSHASMLIRNDMFESVASVFNAYVAILQKYGIVPGYQYDTTIIAGTWTSGDDNEALGGGITLTPGVAGSDFNIVPSGSNVYTLNLPVADAIKTGKLSATNWVTFDSKVDNGENLAGTGEAVFSGKVDKKLQFKRIKAGPGVTVTTVGSEIVVSSATGAGEANDGTSLGAGAAVYKSKGGLTLQFRSITGSNGVLVTPSANEIDISGPELESVGTATGRDVYVGYVGDSHKFRKLKAGSNVSISIVGDDLVINAATLPGTIGEINTASNVGATGFGVFKQKAGANLEFKKLVGGANVTISESSDNITIAASGEGGAAGEANTASNIGTGEGNVFKEKIGVDLVFRKIKQGSNITVTEVGNDIVIAATGGSGSLLGNL